MKRTAMNAKTDLGAGIVGSADARDVLLAHVSEREFMDALISVADTFSWMVYHTHDSRRSQAGFPDLVLCKPPRLLIWEAKRQDGRVKPEQRRWIEALAACGVDARVVRPVDYDDLLAILRGAA